MLNATQNQKNLLPKIQSSSSKNIKLPDENKRLRIGLNEVKKKLVLTEEHRKSLKKAAVYFAAQTL